MKAITFTLNTILHGIAIGDSITARVYIRRTMKAYFVCIIVLLSGFISPSFAETGTGAPLKYISSCEIDLNHDNAPDIAFLVETLRGRELIVLMRSAQGYTAFTVSKDKSDMQLTCQFGMTVTETLAGKGKGSGKVYKTPGAYIKLTLPEGSSVVYFWNDKGFKEVWTSD